MWRILIVIVEYLLKNAVRVFLTSLALGFASSAFVLIAFNKYLDQFLTTASGVDGGILGLAAIAGCHIALSMIIGSLVYVMTVQSLKPRLFKT
jgi:hypothetical protein